MADKLFWRCPELGSPYKNVTSFKLFSRKIALPFSSIDLELWGFWILNLRHSSLGQGSCGASGLARKKKKKSAAHPLPNYCIFFFWRGGGGGVNPH